MGRNARLIAHHGYGHSSRDSSNCTDAIARAYILHGTLPDEAETACYADKKPYLYDVDVAEVAANGEVIRDPIQMWREHPARDGDTEPDVFTEIVIQSSTNVEVLLLLL